ncbi:Metalloexopeptidase [Scheffersomyces amazonensis]|uniref:Metalloexopeptidase n=1 Tax=Scheffersomyces amazonensis TaxID=1078765 RepID=UPI00315D69E1
MVNIIKILSLALAFSATNAEDYAIIGVTNFKGIPLNTVDKFKMKQITYDELESNPHYLKEKGTVFAITDSNNIILHTSKLNTPERTFGNEDFAIYSSYKNKDSWIEFSRDHVHTERGASVAVSPCFNQMYGNGGTIGGSVGMYFGKSMSTDFVAVNELFKFAFNYGWNPSVNSQFSTSGSYKCFVPKGRIGQLFMTPTINKVEGAKVRPIRIKKKLFRKDEVVYDEWETMDDFEYPVNSAPPIYDGGIIHEGEYISIPARLPLPINSSSSTDSFPKVGSPNSINTPIRLNSPSIVSSPDFGSHLRSQYPNSSNKSQSHNTMFSKFTTGRESSPVFNDYDSITSTSTPPITAQPIPTTSIEGAPTLVHKWTHTHSILCVIPAPQKQLLFCGTQDSKILVYDMIEYSLKYEINCGHQDQAASVLTLTISNDEKYLFSAGSDSLIKVWDISHIGNIDKENNLDNQESNHDDGLIHCTHIIYSYVDIGDIFSITWCDSLSTLFIGAQNASILWCHLSFDDNTHHHPHSTLKNIGRLPHFRYDKFFDSRGPGGSINTLQSKQQLLRKNSTNSQNIPNSPKLIEVKNEDIIKFAHNGYVYCMDILRCKTDESNSDFSFHYSDTYDNILISCGGDGLVNIWGINTGVTPWTLSIQKFKSLENEESVISMSIQNSYLYVGLSDSTINVWDLMTFQLIRSFHFESNDSSYDEVLSLCIYNDCIFKASNLGGLVKFNLKSYPVNSDQIFDDENGNNNPISYDKHSTLVLAAEEDTFNKLFAQASLHDSDNNLGSVLAASIFTDKSGATTYLLSGGHKALCLWDITNVGDVKRTKEDVCEGKENLKPSKNKGDIYSNDHLLKSLNRYISFRTISKFPTLYLEDSRQCSQFLCRLLISLGANQTKLLPVENGNPIVYSLFKRNNKNLNLNINSNDNDNDSDNDDSKPTRVLWYAHYDVVDATNHEANDWKTDPFTLTARDGNLYARGVSDNKGPTLASIYAVADLYNKQELSCDVIFIIEGEEECGSIGFQNVINANRSFIGDIDWVMLSNSYWLDDETPCLNYGLRGVINATVSIKSDKPDRHSGVDGGVSKEPTMDLIQILGQLVDPQTNEIKLNGFYDDVLPLTDKEIEFYKTIEDAAITRNINNQDIKTLISKWRNPSLTIHKIQVSGPNNNTVIPQIAKATISIRIVPNQDLEKVKQSLIDTLTNAFKNNHSENHLVVNIFHEAEPWLGDPSNLVYSKLCEKIKLNWGQEPIFIREGGSIPSIRFLEKCFNAPAAQIPCGQASDNAHLINEKLRIINLYKLKAILTDTLRELGN